jgi:hypothetical protein
MTLVADRAAGDLFGLAAIVGVRRVDEVHALLARPGDDAARRRLVGRAPNIMVPRQSGETFTPLRPRLRYCMECPWNTRWWL